MFNALRWRIPWIDHGFEQSMHVKQRLVFKHYNSGQLQTFPVPLKKVFVFLCFYIAPFIYSQLTIHFISSNKADIFGPLGYEYKKIRSELLRVYNHFVFHTTLYWPVIKLKREIETRNALTLEVAPIFCHLIHECINDKHGALRW